MKESVNEFIVYNKFVTGPSSTQQTFFMEMRNALRAAFISPESNDNLTRTIAALPAEKYIFGRDTHFQHFRVIHTANIFLVWPVIRAVSVFFRKDTLYKLSCSMTSLMRAMYINWEGWHQRS